VKHNNKSTNILEVVIALPLNAYELYRSFFGNLKDLRSRGRLGWVISWDIICSLNLWGSPFFSVFEVELNIPVLSALFFLMIIAA
jgi:hypothetical protein